MTEIVKLSAPDFEALARLWPAAYPGAKIVSQEERERFRDRMRFIHEADPTFNFYGLFREGELQGVMSLHDYRMNFLGTDMDAGGVGQIAVDLMHKKEHIARELVAYFLRHYRERGAPLALLYPFRPDFYAAMHFGYGPQMSQYRFRPAALPRGDSKAGVRYLGEDDKQAIRDCFDRYAARTHGMIYKTEGEMRGLLGSARNQIVGCEIEGRLEAYLVYTFEAGDTFITNDLHIHEWISNSPEALARLLTFLHTQADQIRNIIVDTQDANFYHLLLDPRNGSGRLIPSVYHESNTQGVGLMLRLVDVAGMFDRLGEHDFGGQTCTLRLTVDDSFLPENAGSLLLRFEGGHARRLDEGRPDVEVRLDVGRLSSLLAGAVDFRSLYYYGLARISDAGYVATVNRIFAVDQKPVCMTHF